MKINDEIQIANDESMTNDEARNVTFRHSGFVILSSFVIRASSFLLLAVFPRAVQAADNISILGSKPKWSVLEHYQETITRDEFAHLINDVYCTHGLAPDLIEINEKTARILTNRESQKFFTLRFAENDTLCKPVPRLWRVANSLPRANPKKPLSGLRIALDPGHLGGKWAKMEERWFRVGNSPPVREGDLTLKVARILAPQLRRLGAKVSFVRNSSEPITPKRPDDFKELARRILIKNGVPQPLQDELELDDERFEMVRRLLSRAYDQELPLADAIATAMAKETQLPPYQYPTTNSTTKVGSSGYVYARNLLATRLYRCPVVYCEPYVMNSNDVFAQIQAGDYDGTRSVNGRERKSIFREYADGVLDGLIEHYSKARK